MKFQVGDLVTLKHTETEGKITGIENNEMFLVTIDGVEIPVFADNLEHPYFDWFTKERDKKKNLKFKSAEQIPTEMEISAKQKEMGVFLAFFPIFEEKSDLDIVKFKIYLINQDREILYFSYKQSLHSKNIFSIKGQALSFANFYIHDITIDDLHLTPSFDLKIGFQQKQTTDNFIKNEIKIRPKKLFEYLKQIQDGDIAYFQVPLEIDFASKMNLIKEQDITIGNEKANINPILNMPKYVRELDLHIEKLKADYTHLSNADIIQIQLSVFEEALQKAIQNGQSDLTIIHGVGKGVLKQEIHKILKAEIHVRHFISEWSPNYGYGATQVFFNV